MEYLLSLLPLTILFFLRKMFSRYYFSPTGILCITWIAFILLKLILARDFYMSVDAALIFVLFIFSFFVGEFFMFWYTSSRPTSLIAIYMNKGSLEIDLEIFNRDSIKKRLEYVLIILGALSLAGSVLYVQSFLGYFGSVFNVLTAGWALRGALEEISIPLFTRAILMLGYSCIILTLVYNIFYQKFKWYFLLSYISLLIMGITQAGRAGFMMIIFQIFIASYWGEIFKMLKKKDHDNSLLRGPELKLVKRSFRLVLVIAVIFLGGDMLRSQKFGVSSEILGEAIFSFKIYLMGGISAFSSFFENYNYGQLGWGRYSFSSLYDLLGIQKNQLGVYTDYLRISSTDFSLEVNIFTAFRQYIDDFGIIGTVIIMIIGGSTCYIYFRKAVRGDLSSIAFMIVVYTILFHTVLLSITVHNAVLISAVLPYFVIKFLKKSAKFNL